MIVEDNAGAVFERIRHPHEPHDNDDIVTSPQSRRGSSGSSARA